MQKLVSHPVDCTVSKSVGDDNKLQVSGAELTLDNYIYLPGQLVITLLVNDKKVAEPIRVSDIVSSTDPSWRSDGLTLMGESGEIYEVSSESFLSALDAFEI